MNTMLHAPFDGHSPNSYPKSPIYMFNKIFQIKSTSAYQSWQTISMFTKKNMQSVEVITTVYPLYTKSTLHLVLVCFSPLLLIQKC